MTEPLPARVERKTISLEPRGDMHLVREAAEAARMGASAAKAGELRKMALGFAMKMAEKRDPAPSMEEIVADAERTYTFLAKEDA